MKFCKTVSILFVATAVAVCFLFSSCHKDNTEKETYHPTPYKLNIPSYFPSKLNIPEDNPLTVEGVALGKALFNDPLMCGYTGNNPDSMMCCATCHNPVHNYDVGLDNPRFPNGITYGLSGAPTPHSPMPLVNLIFNFEGYFWNGRIHPSNANAQQRTLEDVVSMGIIAPHEFNGSVSKTIAALRTNRAYPVMFYKAFGDSTINIDRVEKAIAQYIRSLVSVNSKFDKYLRGEVSLSPDELAGFVLFTTEEGADCFHCHGSDGTPLFTTNLFYNNGLDAAFSDSRDRYAVTGNEYDRGAYRAPSLRNIFASPPYMHDGRFKTVDEVLNFYNGEVVYSPYISPLMHKVNDGGMLLTPSEMAQLKLFLQTLSDESFLHD